ncbi:uncharacterized protein DFL_000421 [Arthrobotrys flagrans]|uniref:Uncharacterized protein n=1 Tax=Arthrobotrys flagrans TaxID=97331 RepID=A0A437AE85_ARTFL|nr:hypothetical protein DFL_000421 [Arthrobotrys flagrans]
MLPPCGLDGNKASRRLALRQVLGRLEQDPKAGDLLCTHVNHKMKGMAAHKPRMMSELWDEVLGCQVQVRADFRQRMTAPIFWSAIWDDPPDQQRSKDLLLKIVQAAMGPGINFEEALREAWRYTKGQFLDA